VPTKGSIYTLTDPRDGTIRYVGKTTKTLNERLAGHLASPTNPAMRLWINTLIGQRLAPLITLAATAPETRLGDEEERLIRRHIKQGHRLFNAPYYHQHIGDLTAGPPAPRRPASPVASGRESWLLFCHRQYEPIVKARRDGRISTRRTALRVALRALLVAAYTLLRLRTVRYAGYIAAFGWYLSTVGFGPLVKEQILTRLPVSEAAAFWHEYLAGPLSTMALHSVVLLYTYALAAYVEVHGATAPPVDEAPLAAAFRRPPPRTVRQLEAAEVAALAAAALDSAVLPRRP
jgi:hypothetical protein